jgi:hypothetical protein
MRWQHDHTDNLNRDILLRRRHRDLYWRNMGGVMAKITMYCPHCGKEKVVLQYKRMWCDCIPPAPFEMHSREGDRLTAKILKKWTQKLRG